MTAARTYRMILRKETGRTYTVIEPTLPACILWGEHIEHAIEVLKEERKAIPSDNKTLKHSLQLAWLEVIK